MPGIYFGQVYHRRRPFYQLGALHGREGDVCGYPLTAPQEPQLLELPSEAAPHLGQLTPCMMAVKARGTVGKQLLSVDLKIELPVVVKKRVLLVERSEAGCLMINK